MNISEYLSRLNNESQEIFQRSINFKEKLGVLHNSASHIYEFSEIISDKQEKQMLETVSAQLESATYTLTLGLYRQAFSSLRLAFELGLATVYFSAYKLEMQEWFISKNDIKWSKLINEENGVLSKRFVDAFFGECASIVEHYNSQAKLTYRTLSEFVHGNHQTWSEGGIKLIYDDSLIDLYLEHHEEIVKIILFIAVCRYKLLLTEELKEDLYFIPEIFNHIDEFRFIFGQS
ncbi:hypothetical protein [Psychrobacter alimentarius]|uniref:hypothetical protein n=1 Tax=Psychrobacter alimentarius TaxID=261164 RepID=UPI003FD1E473